MEQLANAVSHFIGKMVAGECETDNFGNFKTQADAIEMKSYLEIALDDFEWKFSVEQKISEIDESLYYVVCAEKQLLEIERAKRICSAPTYARAYKLRSLTAAQNSLNPNRVGS